MTENKALLARIEAFDIDGGSKPDFPFAARLAQENGWSRVYAERVIAEYKRFMFLTVSHGRAVCPSEDVDEAWHLHLTFTRSYWQRFCKDALGTEVHHEPTRGGPAEHAKHVAMYEDTLAAYAQAFGSPPPADIWPAAAKRFAHRTTLLSRVQSRFGRAAAVLGLAILGSVGATASFGSPDPFELEGVQFLLVLIPAILAAIGLGRFMHPRLRGALARPSDRTLVLDWAETAYLSGGSPRLATAAMARLVEAGAARLSDDKTRLEPTGAVPAGLTPVETCVLEQLPLTPRKGAPNASFVSLNAAVGRTFRSRAKSLIDRGLMLSRAAERRSYLLAVAPLALVMLLLAFPRLFSGIAKGLPVFFLVLTMALGLIFGLGWIKNAASGQRSARGEAVLARLRDRHAALKSGVGAGSPELIAGATAGFAVALFGTAALAGSSQAELMALDNWLPRRTNETTSGCGGGGCGGGSAGGGSGCGGGCGGCGGGG